MTEESVLFPPTVVGNNVEGSRYWKVYCSGVFPSGSTQFEAERRNFDMATAEASPLASAAVNVPDCGALFTEKDTLAKPVDPAFVASSLNVYVAPWVSLFRSMKRLVEVAVVPDTMMEVTTKDV